MCGISSQDPQSFLRLPVAYGAAISKSTKGLWCADRVEIIFQANTACVLPDKAWPQKTEKQQKIFKKSRSKELTHDRSTTNKCYIQNVLNGGINYSKIN